MEITILRILIFCLDRGLRQFHRSYRWFVTGDPGRVYKAIRNSVERRNPGFFSRYDYYIVMKTNTKVEGDVEVDRMKKGISYFLAKCLVGGEFITNNSFVEMASPYIIVAGLNIKNEQKNEQKNAAE